MTTVERPEVNVDEAIKEVERVLTLLMRLKAGTSDALAQGMLDTLLEQFEDGRDELDAYAAEFCNA
jgi:hypothetical protein